MAPGEGDGVTTAAAQERVASLVEAFAATLAFDAQELASGAARSRSNELLPPGTPSMRGEGPDPAVMLRGESLSSTGEPLPLLGATGPSLSLGASGRLSSVEALSSRALSSRGASWERQPSWERPPLREAAQRNSSMESASGSTATKQAFADWARREVARGSVSVETFILRSASLEGSTTCSSSSGTPKAGSSHSRGGELLPPMKPHDGFTHGAPAPACMAARTRTADGINALRVTRDGEIESKLRLLCTIFDTDTATVALLTGKAIYLTGACGALPVCECPPRWGFCGWSFLNANHDMLVVEDMDQDHRFADNFFVVDPAFHLKFYCAAPLISADGHRLGTLCIMGQEPRRMDATRAQVLNNVAEMLVRQLEKGWAEAEAARNNARLQRSLTAYNAAFLFVDMAAPEWRILDMNPAAARLLGCDWHATYEELAATAGAQDFLGKGEPPRSRRPFAGVELSRYLDVGNALTRYAVNEEFVAAAIAVAHEGTKSLEPGANPPPPRAFQLHFRPASTERLDEHAPFAVGVPAYLADGPNKCNYYFAVLREVPAVGAPQPAPEESGPGRPLPCAGPFEGLVLGPLLGSGAFGKVYRGMYHLERVAVKVITKMDAVRMRDGVPLEVAVTRGLRHHGIMRTLRHAEHLRRRRDGSLATELWLLLEFCDKGTLVDAAVKGWFRTARAPSAGGCDVRAVALTAYEVASAMAALHARGIVHGDLTGGNVMLATSEANQHGFCAKVADFGLARVAGAEKRIEDNQYGTVTHMPPETLMSGEVNQTTDTYAFGVLLWEMLTSTRAWAGLRHEQILVQVGLLRRRLEIPAAVPTPLAQLLRGCLAPEPERRPTFSAIVPILEYFLQATRATYLDQHSIIVAPGDSSGVSTPLGSAGQGSQGLSSGGLHNSAGLSSGGSDDRAGLSKRSLDDRAGLLSGSLDDRAGLLSGSLDGRTGLLSGGAVDHTCCVRAVPRAVCAGHMAEGGADSVGNGAPGSSGQKCGSIGRLALEQLAA